MNTAQIYSGLLKKVSRLIILPKAIKSIRQYLRVKLTVSCRDTDYIDKVEDAGDVKKYNGKKCKLCTMVYVSLRGVITQI